MYAHSAPNLSRTDIVKCLSEMGIAVSEAQLTKPSPETTHRIYTAFAELLAGFNAAEAAQPRFAANDIMEYPELHEESIPQMAFQVALMRLMYAVGVGDFSMRDVTNPSERRTREHLSAVINFAKFRETCLTKYEAVTNRTEELAERKSRADTQCAELSAALRKLQAQLERDQPEVERLRAEVASRTEELGRLNAEQSEISASIARTKERAEEAAERANGDGFVLLGVRQECVKLKSQIVQSPEKLKGTLEGLTARAEDERSAVKEAERKSLDLRARAEALGRVDKDLARALEAMAECAAERDAKRDVKAKRIGAERNAEQSERAVRELATAEEALAARAHAIADKRRRAEKQHQLKEGASRQALSAAEAEHASVKRSAEGAKRQVEREAEAAEAVRRDMGEMAKAHEAEMAGIREQFAKVEEQVRAYHESIFAALEASQSGLTPAKA